MSQAEHDPMASAILITNSRPVAEGTVEELTRQMATLSRREIIQQSLDRFGGVIICENLDEAVDFANELAPEHLEVCVQNPFEYIGRLDNAGSVFLGNYSPEPLGDYFAGANHVLPTGGTARFFSPLSVDEEVQFYLLSQSGTAKGRPGYHPFGGNRGAHCPRQFHPCPGGGLRGAHVPIKR